MRDKLLFIMFVAIGMLYTAVPISAQTSTQTSSSETDTLGGYKVSSSIELGVRGLGFEGSDEKFRSDLNYRPGFRIWNSSFRLEAKDGKKRPFDSLSVTTSGWGADRAGFIRVGVAKTGAYRFDANVRQVNLINRVSNLTLGYHSSDTIRNFGDFDVVIFPENEKLRFRFGVSFNKAGGDRGSSYRTRDVFPLVEKVNNRAVDLRQGVDTKLAGFKMTFTAGLRTFKDQGRYLIESRQPGVAGSCFFGICISPTDVNFINRYDKSNPTNGDTKFGIFTMQRTFAKKVDLTGRFIYSETDSKFNIFENVNYDGQIRLPSGVTSPTLFVDSDIYRIIGRSKRPQSRGDLGLTWTATDKVRFSNTFTFDQFTSFGDSDFSNFTTARVQSTGLPYLPGVPSLETRSLYWRQHNFKRFTNTVEGDFQINNWIGVFLGYRFTHRKVGEGLRNETVDDLLNRPLTGATFSADEEENSAHTILFGAKLKPTKNWVLFADGEHGSADNAFIRLANYDYTNFRVRSNWSYKKFNFNVSGIVRNNENPSRSEDYRNATTGAIILPAFDIIANVRSRVFSAYVDYTPDPRWTMSTGYTYSYMSSKTDTVVPLSLNAALPPNPVGNFGFLRGFSEFYMKDNFFFVDLSGRPNKRISVYASYRYNNDKGQGNQVSTLMERFLSSYPFTTHVPELRMAIKLTRNIDWNLGYQYNRYDERLQFGYFPYNELTNTNVIPANSVYPTNQNYRAHLPYMSLTIYFGGGAADR
ncbi:MAG: hypothetical protein K1X36_01835 [Pyrinomonadaceae bacterium]|nr:hypothetical protein [Pyrinomonadaceae bacterium]